MRKKIGIYGSYKVKWNYGLDIILDIPQYGVLYIVLDIQINRYFEYFLITYFSFLHINFLHILKITKLAIRGQRYTIEGALCIDGLLAYGIQKGLMSANDFEDFIENILVYIYI